MKKPPSPKKRAAPAATPPSVPPDTSAENRLRAGLRRYAPRAGLFVLVFLALLPVPRLAYTINHDFSSHATFEYYALHRFQFGRDVVQNVGPLGFAHYARTYVGWVQGRKMLVQIFLKTVLAGLVLWTASRFRSGGVRAAWLLLFLLHAGLRMDHPNREVDVFTADIWPYLTVYLAALYLIEAPRDRAYVRLAPVLVYTLAVLAVMKHNLLMLGTAVLAVAAAADALRRRWHGPTWLAVYAAGLGVNWILAGQAIANVPAFLGGIRDFSAGYNEAMRVAEPGVVTAAGSITLAAGMAAILYRGLRARPRRDGLPRAAVEMLLLALVWKHGFVRADEHVLVFFGFMLWFALVLVFAPRLDVPVRAVPLLAAAYVVLALLGAWASVVDLRGLDPPTSLRYSPGDAAVHLARNVFWLVRPGKARAEMEAELAHNREAFALPRIAAQIGQARVDFFGYEPGGLLLNGLRWTPRPMPMSFMAASERLMKRNEAFYRDAATAPEFVVVSYGSIDDRFAPPDDALALRALFDDYTPVGTEAGLVLLRRLPEPRPATGREEPLRRLRLRPGEPLSLKEYADRYLWARVWVRHTAWARLRSLVYKPPACYVEVRYADGTVERSRFVTTAGPAGFLLSPALRDNRTLLAVWADDPALATRPVAVRFPREASDPYFDGDVEIELSAIDPPRARVHLSPRGPAS